MARPLRNVQRAGFRRRCRRRTLRLACDEAAQPSTNISTSRTSRTSRTRSTGRTSSTPFISSTNTARQEGSTGHCGSAAMASPASRPRPHTLPHLLTPTTPRSSRSYSSTTMRWHVVGTGKHPSCCHAVSRTRPTLADTRCAPCRQPTGPAVEGVEAVGYRRRSFALAPGGGDTTEALYDRVRDSIGR